MPELFENRDNEATENVGKLVEAAIKAHLAIVRPDEDVVMGDWFVAYGTMGTDEDYPGRVLHGREYISSSGSPHGVYGVAKLSIADLKGHLTGMNPHDIMHAVRDGECDGG